MGLGYIGLPTALVAANNNLQVFGYDVDEKKIQSIRMGKSPIIEPGIQELLTQASCDKTFCASTELHPADYFIIAVPTPFNKDKSPDLSYVFDAVVKICEKLRPGNTIILESTVPVGTTQKLTQLIEKNTNLRASKDFFLAYCPERVLPGKIVYELVNNNRIIGGICQESAKKATGFYSHFVTGDCFLTSDKIAEMVKLVENSSRDVQIALANQIAQMCNVAHIDPNEVIKLANKHPRVNLLQPGCGVGGHCIAVDPWFLIKHFPKQTLLLQAARKINDDRPYDIINSIVSQAKKFKKIEGRKPKVLTLGLTFKPDVDDLRQSPALFIAQELNKLTDLLALEVHDPFVPERIIKSYGLKNNKNLETIKIDIVQILVKHTVFQKIGENHETIVFKKGENREPRRTDSSPQTE